MPDRSLSVWAPSVPKGTSFCDTEGQVSNPKGIPVIVKKITGMETTGVKFLMHYLLT